MKTKKRPYTFSITGHNFKIKYKKNINSENTLGMCKFYDSEILIRTHYDGKQLPEDQVLQIVAHEVLHSALTVLNKHELNSDEEFVDSLSQVLYQVVKTMR